MAVIRPFKALRPTIEKAQLVASVPYDVVNKEEARQFADGNPLSYLHITRSEIDLPDGTDVYSKQVYQKAKENLNRIIKEAPLKVDDKLSFYLYRLIMDGRSQTGICATFSVDDYDNDVILKHEKTRKVKEDDRTNHIVTTEAQTGIVFLTYRGVKTVNEIVDNTIKEVKPEYDFTTPDGIQHTVWIVPEKFNQTMANEFKSINKLYIADGHHRAKSASRAREEKKKVNPNHKGDEEYNYFVAVLFPEDQLKILPYNRVVFDLNGLSKDDFLNAVSEKFEVKPTTNKQPQTKNQFCMYLQKQWYHLKARDSVLASLSLEKSVGEKLDVSILQNFLLTPVTWNRRSTHKHTNRLYRWNPWNKRT